MLGLQGWVPQRLEAAETENQTPFRGVRILYRFLHNFATVTLLRDSLSHAGGNKNAKFHLSPRSTV